MFFCVFLHFDRTRGLQQATRYPSPTPFTPTKHHHEQPVEKISARSARCSAFCHYFVCLFLPGRHRRPHSIPTRLVGRTRSRAGSPRILSENRRALALDQFHVRRNAHLSDGSFVQQHRRPGQGHQGLPLVAARKRVVSVCLSAGLLHHAARLRLPLASGSAGKRSSGLSAAISSSSLPPATSGR